MTDNPRGSRQPDSETVPPSAQAPNAVAPRSQAPVPPDSYPLGAGPPPGANPQQNAYPGGYRTAAHPQYPPSGYPPSGYPPVYPYTQPPRTGPGLPPPVAVQPVPHTPFGVAIVGVAPTVSGPAAASLVAGVGSILVAFAVGGFGVLGARPGWGPMVAGAFAVLAGLVGVAALVLGRVGLRQVRRGSVAGAVTGRGAAIAGISCGMVGLVLVLVAFLVALFLTAGD